MPWKLIFFVLIIVLVVVFTGQNLENKTNISVIFYTFYDVPVFISLLYAFCGGIVCMLPFTFRRKSKKEKAIKPEKNNKTTDILNDDGTKF